MNPDEAVAIGAAIQAAGCRAGEEDVLLLDVQPLSLGIETLGGVMTALIERNTTIPTSAKQTFSTAADNQPSVEIHVLQGERSMAQDNKSLARFILDGILPAPRGVPQVEVEFNIDANGMVTVAARDKATSKEQHISIEPGSGLSKDEVEKLRREAETFASDDRTRRDTVELRNAADSLAYSAEKTLRENADKVPADLKERVEASVAEVRDALKGEDTQRIQEAMDELSTRMQEIGQAVYGASTSANGSEPGPGGDRDEDGDREAAGAVKANSAKSRRRLSLGEG